MNRNSRMNIDRTILFIVQTMVLVPSSILAHTPAETNRLVRILADRATSFSSCDTPDPNEVVCVPDYTNPDVFFRSITNQLHAVDPPLPQVMLGEEGTE